MSHRQHGLAEEFPEHVDKIHSLKADNAHFANLVTKYDAINAVIHRAETNVEPMAADAETTMRKERMVLKDEIYRMLTQS